jgi:molybdopterin molybdotransferase
VMPMKTFIGFQEALELTLSQVTCGETEILPLERLVGSVLAEDVTARVDCPSVSASRKDGYAAVSTDLAAASVQNKISLELKGSLSAGDRRELKIKSGQAVRVTTGAPLPDGADAVLSEEFCRSEGNTIAAFNTAEAGRNVLQRARDIRLGETVAEKNMRLHPALIGLLAAAGLDAAAVDRRPRVAVPTTGDEVVRPGSPLQRGQLYASNMVEICAWLSQFGLPYQMELVPDRSPTIENTITKHLPDVDAFLTSGGAWGSERDLILEVVEALKWRAVYHRVRMGPGKPVGFGLLAGKPFFCLPGGPPSNEMAFLQLALPALLKMKGDNPFPFPSTSARLAETVHGKQEWTDFIHAGLKIRQNQLSVYPARLKSTLQSMARKEALITIPEDREKIVAGEIIEVQVLSSKASC